MHQNLSKSIFVMVWIFLTVAPTANAEETYITENLEIPVRSGESREHRIIRYLKAGTQIEVLQTFGSGYTKIKDKQGREGFILDRYLEKNPPAFLRALRLKTLVAKQKETIRRLRKTVEKLTAQSEFSNQSLEEIKNQLATKESEFKEFLSTAGDSITIRTRLLTLETERQALISNNETLIAEKLAIGDDSSKAWFALGALTIAFGWFIGMLMPRMRKTRIDNTL